MGEARRRGTFEERKAAAIKRDKERIKNLPEPIVTHVNPIYNKDRAKTVAAYLIGRIFNQAEMYRLK